MADRPLLPGRAASSGPVKGDNPPLDGSAQPIRVLVVEDHRLVADALMTMFSLGDGFEVCGWAETGEAAVEMTASLAPDVVLMDVSLGGMDGVEAARLIIEADPEAKVLMLSMHDDVATISRSVAAGALGFVPKNAEREDLFRAVSAVAAGDAFLHQRATKELLNRVGPMMDRELSGEKLSRREQDVLQLLAEGCSTKEIAVRLGVGEQTVKTYLSRLYQKLGAADRSNAVAIGLRRGIIG